MPKLIIRSRKSKKKEKKIVKRINNDPQITTQTLKVVKHDPHKIKKKEVSISCSTIAIAKRTVAICYHKIYVQVDF